MKKTTLQKFFGLRAAPHWRHLADSEIDCSQIIKRSEARLRPSKGISRPSGFD
jgi:hypothetical protein